MSTFIFAFCSVVCHKVMETHPLEFLRSVGIVVTYDTKEQKGSRDKSFTPIKVAFSKKKFL